MLQPIGMNIPEEQVKELAEMIEKWFAQPQPLEITVQPSQEEDAFAECLEALANIAYIDDMSDMQRRQLARMVYEKWQAVKQA